MNTVCKLILNKNLLKLPVCGNSAVNESNMFIRNNSNIAYTETTTVYHDLAKWTHLHDILKLFVHVPQCKLTC